MIKPIFVVYLKDTLSPSQISTLDKFRYDLKKEMNEYHVLFLMGKETKCELFNSEKIDPIEFGALQDKLKNILDA